MRLQLITDTQLQSRFSHLELGQMAFRAGAPAVQYRNKGFDRAQDLAELKELVALADSEGKMVIVNDSAALAAEVGAQGLHLGKDDGSLEEARKIVGDGVVLGATVHTMAELDTVRDQPIDYIGVGPVYGTRSKSTGLPDLGLDGLAEICAASPFPVVGIGGIASGNAAAVHSAGAAGIAVLGAFCMAEDPEAAALQLVQLVEGWA